MAERFGTLSNFVPRSREEEAEADKEGQKAPKVEQDKGGNGSTVNGSADDGDDGDDDRER